jgi:hypothetical protein
MKLVLKSMMKILTTSVTILNKTAYNLVNMYVQSKIETLLSLALVSSST